MNQLWGSMDQYHQIAWHWEIAVYLFLAGLSAGAAISAVVVKKISHHSESNGLVKAGAVIAPIAIAAGLLLLIFDLTRPLNFWRLLVHYNFTSVMSVGVLALFIYFPLTLLLFAATFHEKFSSGMFACFKPIAGLAKSLGKVIDALVLLFGVIIGAYTGFLLSAMNSHSLLNTPVLPILFLASGLSSGICANIIVGMVWFHQDLNINEVASLDHTDKIIIYIELLLLFALFVGMFYQGQEAAATAAQALTHSAWAGVFWIGAVGVGLLLPLVLNFAFSSSFKSSPSKFIMFNATLVILGVLSLRFYILYAGQMFS
ncbi:MAG: polysulfide reductase NrfD [Burkholderiales bacterium]|jgi:polysulfide reductase chain C|nr:polysulfide reductase NrfD [Burkholderiales bacterium]